MNPGRRIEVPNAPMVQVHLAEERDLAVRLRLTLLNLILELPQAVTLEEICRGMSIPMSTAYVWIRAWRTHVVTPESCAPRKAAETRRDRQPR